jgi:general secretion pathway protein A
MLRLLRAVLERKQTGVLELSLESGAVDLYFLSGELYLSPREVDWVPEIAELDQNQESSSSGHDYQHESLAIAIASRMATWNVRSFRFRDGLAGVPEQLTGPFSTARLAMELVSQRRRELNLEYLIGGRDARVVGIRRAEPTVEMSRLGRRELALVHELQKPMTVTALLERDPGGREETLVALARLWVAGMVSELGPSDLPEEDSGATRRDDVSPVVPSEAIRQPGSRPYTREALDEPAISEPDAIWKDHFRLKANPFSMTPDPAFLYLSESHAEALAGLKLSLLERRGLACMTGEVGTGKTTLLYSLLSTLGAEVETAYVNNPALPVDQILKAILEDFELEGHGSTKLELLNALNDFLLHCAGRGVTVALIFDEAQVLSDEAFEEIRLLLNFENYDQKLLQIILVGQQELGIRLQSWKLRQLADRVAIRCRLEPLSYSDSRKYIGHRLEAAGGSSDLFTHQALRLIAKKCRGIPRRINVVCHNAMLYAYGDGVRKVDHKMANEAIRESLRSPNPLTLWRYQRSGASDMVPQPRHAGGSK